MQNTIHRCTTVYLMFKIHKCIMDCECANRLSCVNRPGFVCVYFWDFHGSALLQRGSLVLFSQSDASSPFKLIQPTITRQERSTQGALKELSFAPLLRNLTYLQRKWSFTSSIQHGERHCMIFGCPRWKTGIVKQSWWLLIGYDCFTMPIFCLGQPKIMQCV